MLLKLAWDLCFQQVNIWSSATWTVYYCHTHVNNINKQDFLAQQSVLTLQSSACVPAVQSKCCSSASNQINPTALQVATQLRRMSHKLCQQLAPVWVLDNVLMSHHLADFSPVSTFCWQNVGDSREGLIIPLSGVNPGCLQRLFFTLWQVSGLCARLLVYLLIVQEELFLENNLR